jgi:hypothetical protein
MARAVGTCKKLLHFALEVVRCFSFLFEQAKVVNEIRVEVVITGERERKVF